MRSGRPCTRPASAARRSAWRRRCELLHEMRPLVEGTYIMPSFGRYEQSAELVRRVRAELVGAGTNEPTAS